MLIVLSLLGAVLLAFFVILAIRGTRLKNDDMQTPGVIFSILAACLCFIPLAVSISYISDIANAHTIDSKIVMYEEENAKIEGKINDAVANYLTHEQETLTGLNPDNAMAVLAAYPELKSDTLVASQVEKYISNTEEIKHLKRDKIDISRKKWWVYFGR